MFLTRTRNIVRSLLNQIEHERSSVYLVSTDRLIQFLLDYYDQYAVDATSIVPVRLTRDAIGERTGFSIRTINRAVCNLSNQGLISLKKGKVVLLPSHRQRLQEVLEDNLNKP